MSYTLIEERKIKSARKNRPCNWCGERIAVGEPYVRERSIFEGDPQTNPFHPECAEACKEAARDSDGDFCYDSWSMPRGRVDWDQTESAKRPTIKCGPDDHLYVAKAGSPIGDGVCIKCGAQEVK